MRIGQGVVRLRLGRVGGISRRLRLSVRPTPVGAGFLILLTVLLLVAVNPGANLLLLIFGFGVGIAAFNWIVAGSIVRSISVQRYSPDVAAAGRPMRIRYRLRGCGTLTSARCLWLLEHTSGAECVPPSPAAFVEHVGRGKEEIVEAVAVPVRRGRLRVDGLTVMSDFPFGLVSRSRRINIAPQEIIVWPSLWRTRFDWLAERAWQEHQEHASSGKSRKGEDEFYGIREYRPGDNLKWIHWRKSASLGRLLVREMARTTPGRIVIALETASGEAALAEDVLESLVSAAASLICAAVERGWHVGLIANGQPSLILPPAGGRQVRSRLLTELATLKAAETGRLCDLLGDLASVRDWQGRAVLITPCDPDEDAAAALAMKRLAAIGPVKCITPRSLEQWFETQPVSGLGEAAAAGSRG